MLVKLSFSGSLLVFIIFCSCKKSITRDGQLFNDLNSAAIANQGVAVQAIGTGGYCREDAENGARYDTALTQTLLGAKLNGTPYALATMRQAYLNLTGSNSGVVANKKYVRFKPANFAQMAVLSKLDIDLFDYPLDYEIIQEGDYYNDGVTTEDQIPWLYTVVDNSFVMPSGITYELLQTIHVPDDYRIENEAFRLTGNTPDTATCSGNSGYSAGAVVSPNSIPVCDCSGSPYDMTCECRTYCGYDPCATPLPPAPVTRIPGGRITVTDDVQNNQVAVRKARLVARRFLKVDRTYTDNNGNYHFSKSFRNKFTLLIKFKNDNAMVNPMMTKRGYKMLYPTKINWGRFRGDVNNVSMNIDDNNDITKRGALHWAAATMHNLVQEYIQDRATAEGIGAPPNGIVIIISNGKGGSTAPMFNKRVANTSVSTTYWQWVFMPYYPGYYSVSVTNQLAAVLTGRADMMVKYGQSDGITKASDQMAEVGYHELTHAAHYNKVGNTWYDQFVRSEVAQIIDKINSSQSPYGSKNTADGPIIALGESWAYYMGHFLTYRKYGNKAGTFREQGSSFSANSPALLNSSNLNLLEYFDPNKPNDVFNWIPQGLFYDLYDNRNDKYSTPVIFQLDDNVSNYTNQQFFNALDADILTLPTYKTRLLSENGNNQAAGVNYIFTYYGY